MSLNRWFTVGSPSPPPIRRMCGGVRIDDILIFRADGRVRVSA